MEYSFKKHRKCDFYLGYSFVLTIAFLALAFFNLIIVYWAAGDILLDPDLKSIAGGFYLVIVIFFLIPPLFSISLFIKVNKAKKLLEDYSETSAVIEEYRLKMSSGRGLRTVVGIIVYFSYTINDNNYLQKFNIAANMEYTHLYTEQGKKVTILVDNKNPKNIVIKELFQDDDSASLPPANEVSHSVKPPAEDQKTFTNDWVTFSHTEYHRITERQTADREIGNVDMVAIEKYRFDGSSLVLFRHATLLSPQQFVDRVMKVNKSSKFDYPFSTKFNGVDCMAVEYHRTDFATFRKMYGISRGLVYNNTSYGIAKESLKKEGLETDFRVIMESVRFK